MIELSPNKYYLALWFVGHDERLPVAQRMDWLCMVWKETPESAWSLAYRFSYHVSNLPLPEGRGFNATPTVCVAREVRLQAWLHRLHRLANQPTDVCR